MQGKLNLWATHFISKAKSAPNLDFNMHILLLSAMLNKSFYMGKLVGFFYISFVTFYVMYA